MANRPITVFRGTSGLRTTVDPSEESLNRKAGRLDLSACGNVDVSDSGQHISMRAGRKKIYAPSLGDVHSVFSTRHLSRIFFVEGDQLSAFDPVSLSVARIHTLVDRLSPMEFEHVNGRIYYSNGTDIGYVEQDTLARMPWEPEGTYSGPETTRVFSGPPTQIRCMKAYGGRMYLGVENFVVFSEPFDFGRYVLDEGNIPFTPDAEVILFGVTSGGLVIGTSRGAWYMAGPDPGQSELIQIWDAPIIAGTGQAVFPSTDFGTEDMRRSFMCMSADGLLLVTPDAMATNLTKGKIDVPQLAGHAGQSVIFDGRYVCRFNVDA